jgi:hypothetical protein
MIYFVFLNKKMIMDTLRRRFLEKYHNTSTKVVRDFYKEIDWSDRLIGIKGQRGVGKTTLLLQYIKTNLEANNETLYASLDHLYFTSTSLYSFAEEFIQKGGKYLFLDEVHRYKNWAFELKNIYDDFPQLKIVFTGSSMLHIRKANADLSRRAIVYTMPGLSFREFVHFETDINFSSYTVQDILDNHSAIASELSAKFKPLAYFENYLEMGYYSFYLENKNTYHHRLSEVINMVLEVDIAQYEEIQTSHVVKLKLLLSVISESAPFKPNINKLAERTGISVNTLKQYLGYLTDADLIILLQQSGKGVNCLSKPEKIYLNNPNLMFTLSGDEADKGNIRETFFANQLSRVGQINASPITDFLFENEYSFEIGGKYKKRKQISKLDNAFIVKDYLEIGLDNNIPLWLFGFLY